MKNYRKPRTYYAGICNADNHAIVEAFGTDKAEVTKKTLAGALCFGENTFQIATSEAGHYTRVELYTITNPTAGEFTLTDI